MFWNVDSRNLQQPVTKNEQGVILVSGCTPAVFGLLTGEGLDPWNFMLSVLQSGRYGPIRA